MSAALRATAVFASLLAAGCYGVENDLESDTAALSASEDGATSNVGSLDAPRGIEELDGFLLYWKQHSNWEQGACLELRLRNTGCAVENWEVALDLDQQLTYWADEGGAFFWPQGDVVLVEPESSGYLGVNESTVFYFCAEPAVRIQAFDLRSLSTDCGDSGSSSSSDSGDDGSTTDDGGTGDDGSTGDDGTTDTTPTDYSGRVVDGDIQMIYNYDELNTEGLNCYDLTFQNNGDEPVTMDQVAFAMSDAVVDVSNPETGSAYVTADGSEIIYAPDTGARWIAAGARSDEFSLCWTPRGGIESMTVTVVD